MDLQKLIESLGPNEMKILPNLDEKKVEDISKKSNLEKGDKNEKRRRNFLLR